MLLLPPSTDHRQPTAWCSSLPNQAGTTSALPYPTMATTAYRTLSGKPNCWMQNNMPPSRTKPQSIPINHLTFTPDQIATLPVNTNWMDQMFVKDAPTQSHTIGVTGGSNYFCLFHGHFLYSPGRHCRWKEFIELRTLQSSPQFRTQSLPEISEDRATPYVHV